MSLLSAALWWSAAGAGLVAAWIAIDDAAALWRDLGRSLLAVDSGRGRETTTAVARVAVVTCLTWLTVTAAATLALAWPARTSRGARRVLVTLGVLDLAALAVYASALDGGTRQPLLRVLLVGHGVLVVAALVTALSRRQGGGGAVRRTQRRHVGGRGR